MRFLRTSEFTEGGDRGFFGNLTMTETCEAWEEKRDYLQRHVHSVEVKWSCERVEERKDLDVSQILANINLRDPMCVRDSFFGGRTNAWRLYYEVSGSEKFCTMA